MTKSEFVSHVAERLPYLTHGDAEIILDTIFGSMADALAKGRASNTWIRELQDRQKTP